MPTMSISDWVKQCGRTVLGRKVKKFIKMKLIAGVMLDRRN